MKNSLTIKVFLIILLDSSFSWDLKLGNNQRDDELLDSFPRRNSLTSKTINKFDDSDATAFDDFDSYQRNEIPTLTKTQFYYKTHQSGSVSVPSNHQRGNRLSVGPDEDDTEEYVAKVDTTVVSPRKQNYKRSKDKEDDMRSHLKPFFRTGKYCIKCPPEKILIAKRSLDGVLIEPPQLTTCNNDQPISRALYDVETLFSPKQTFILPRGSHTFIGRIINKRTYTIEHVCYLKYKIIVRSCGPFIPKNEGVKVKCDMADIWGSKCTFFCKNGILTHREPVICNDQLQWVGEEPECIIQQKEYFHDIEAAITSCQLPIAPEHAKFSCKVNRESINESENDIFIPDATVCRVKCARYHEIPSHLHKFSTFYCHNGRWNYTRVDFCHKIQPKRYG